MVCPKLSALMKPATTLSLVVIAVLTTLVVEERRIKDLRSQLIDLRALRAENAASTPQTASPEAKGTPEPEAEADELVGHQLPPDFPAPDLEQIKALALGDRADLYLEMGFTSTEQAYVEMIVTTQLKRQQELAAAWLAAAPEERESIDAELNQLKGEADDALRAFLNNDEELALLKEGLSLQADRDHYKQLVPFLTIQGVTFDKAKEDRFIEAMHEIRRTLGAIDWNSPDALAYHATGNAGMKFREEWKRTGEALEDVLPVFLTEKEVDAVFAARKEVFESWIEMISPTVEETPEADPEEAVPEPAEE